MQMDFKIFKLSAGYTIQLIAWFYYWHNVVIV